MNKHCSNIADKALRTCVSYIFCGIHEILLLFNKIKKKMKVTDNLMIQAGLDFPYTFVDI